MFDLLPQEFNKPLKMHQDKIWSYEGVSSTGNRLNLKKNMHQN